jgi:hypothetical protein
VIERHIKSIIHNQAIFLKQVNDGISFIIALPNFSYLTTSFSAPSLCMLGSSSTISSSNESITSGRPSAFSPDVFRLSALIRAQKSFGERFGVP